MFPEIASWGPLTIHSYGLLIALGVLLALVLMSRTAARWGFPPPEKVLDLVFVTIFSGFVGARLFYVIQQWSFYRDHGLDIFKIWEGGLIFSGGMLGSFLGLFFFSRKSRLSFLNSCDFAVTFIPLVHAFGRVGCLLNGCCYGEPCELPWAVPYPFLTERVHPVQIYEAILNLALFGFLLRLYPLRRFAGETTSLYFMIYPAARFLLEFWRGDQQMLFFSLTGQQIMFVLFFIAGMVLYLLGRRRNESPAVSQGKIF
jgi:phosphatidylglycerol:prolipoprotein diacylglycerol transferase